MLSQSRHHRHQSQLDREGSLQIVLVHPAGPHPTATTSQRHMDTNISSERERVSTGAVLSQCRQRRHHTQLGRKGSLQIVVVHVAGPPQQPPPLSDTWTRISPLRGSACRRVRCSHNCVIAVMRPSSVGRVPSRLFWYTQLHHHHSHHLSATHGHEYLK